MSKDKLQSLDDAYKEQASEYPNKSINLTPDYKKTPEMEKVTEQENARYKEGKRQQRMEELSKTVKPFKKGGKVAGKLATRGYGKAR